MESEIEPIFESLKIDGDYEITNNLYPFIIRRKDNKRVVKVGRDYKGYNVVCLNRCSFLLHRVIARQFIPNPNNLLEVDHINRIKDDNRIENLRWCSRSMNQNNKTSYNNTNVNYEDELSEDAIEVKEYGKHQLEYIYFDDDKFYYWTGAAYRELYYNVGTSDGSLYINVKDTNRINTKIYLNRFKKLNGL